MPRLNLKTIPQNSKNILVGSNVIISDTGLRSSIRFFMGNRKPQFAVTRLQFHVAEKF